MRKYPTKNLMRASVQYIEQLLRLEFSRSCPPTSPEIGQIPPSEAWYETGPCSPGPRTGLRAPGDSRLLLSPLVSAPELQENCCLGQRWRSVGPGAVSVTCHRSLLCSVQWTALRTLFLSLSRLFLLQELNRNPGALFRHSAKFCWVTCF